MSSTVLHVEYEFTDEAKRAIPSLLDTLAEFGEIFSQMPRTVSG
jgi:hypothetical protein